MGLEYEAAERHVMEILGHFGLKAGSKGLDMPVVKEEREASERLTQEILECIGLVDF